MVRVGQLCSQDLEIDIASRAVHISDRCIGVFLQNPAGRRRATVIPGSICGNRCECERLFKVVQGRCCRYERDRR